MGDHTESDQIGEVAEESRPGCPTEERLSVLAGTALSHGPHVPRPVRRSDAPPGSPRGDHRDAVQRSRGRESVVVADDAVQFVAELQRRGEVQRVQAAK